MNGSPERFVAQLMRRRGRWRIWAWDPKRAAETRALRLEQSAGRDAGPLRDGDYVVVERIGGHGGTRCRVVERLGSAREPGTDGRVVLAHYGIPDEHPSRVRAEARRLVKEKALPEKLAAGEEKRVDLRDLLTVTIDGEDARDFDDAISADRAADGRIRLGVHIADVSHWVRPGSPLDEEAARRGTSVYLPDRAIHMLPPELSEGLCSLRPDEDRLTLSLDVLLSPAGEVLDFDWKRSRIRSAARLTYQQVESFLRADIQGAQSEADSAGGDGVERRFWELLRAARDAASALRRKRVAAGGLDLDLPAPRMILDESGEIAEIVSSERLESHRLIEELMVLANRLVAETLAGDRPGNGNTGPSSQPALFRVHPEPNPEDLEPLEVALKRAGVLKPQVTLVPSDLGEAVAAATGLPQAELVSLLTLRALKQATYEPECSPHFALALASYCHFTSPIRRYPDLVVHRALKRIARVSEPAPSGRGAPKARRATGGRDERLRDPSTLGREMSRLERRAESAELVLLKWRKLRYLSKRIGLEAQGLVTGVEEFGVFVLLVELGVDGLLPLDHLPEDHYELAEDRQFLVGARAGRRFQLGDNLRVRVHEISERRRRLVLSLPGEPRRRRDSQPASRSGPRNRRQSQKNRPARKPRSSSGQGTRTRR